MTTDAQLEILTHAIELCDGFELHFAIVPGPRQEQALADHLRELGERLGLALLELDASSGALSAQLVASDQPRLTLLRTVDASRRDPAALARCLVELNPRRDLIAGRHRGPLVIAGRPDALRRVVELAPDLYSVHTSLVQIERPEHPRPPPSWRLFDHEAIGLLGLDPSFRVFEGQAIPSFRVALPEPPELPAPARESAALTNALLDPSTRVRVSGPRGAGPWWLVAKLVRAHARNWDELLWLDGSAPSSTLLYDLVRALLPAGARPPVDADDLAASYLRATANRRVLIVVDEPREPLLSPSSPSKLVELGRELAGADVQISAPTHPLPARPPGLGLPRAWEELRATSVELDAPDHARLWRLTRGLLDTSLPGPVRDAAERRWRDVSPELVDAAEAVCAPADAPAFLAAVAELHDSPGAAAGYLRRAIELALCVHAPVEVYAAWLERLAELDRSSAANLRFLSALRHGHDHTAALFEWIERAPVDARVVPIIRRVIRRDTEPAASPDHDPRAALVELLRRLDAHDVAQLEAAVEQVRERWRAGSALLEHPLELGRCLLHLAGGRWEAARVALERADAAASASGAPHALLRAKLLDIEYARARGDIEYALASLPAARERAEQLLGPLHPASLELLATSVVVHDASARSDQARVLADELWRRLDYVDRPPEALLADLLAFVQADGQTERAARIHRRWAHVLAPGVLPSMPAITAIRTE